MSPQTLGINEGLGAESAGVGSLASVNHPVSLETGRVFVGLPTVATLVWSAAQRERSVSSLRTTTTYVGQNIAGFGFNKISNKLGNIAGIVLETET